MGGDPAVEPNSHLLFLVELQLVHVGTQHVANHDDVLVTNMLKSCGICGSTAEPVKWRGSNSLAVPMWDYTTLDKPEFSGLHLIFNCLFNLVFKFWGRP